MSHSLRLPLAVLALLAAGDAHAQYNRYTPGPAGRYSRAPVSPYLNLLRGRNPAVNYYLGVRSEFELRATDQAVGQLQRQVADQAALAPGDDEAAPVLGATGHPTYFMTTAPYYAAPYGPTAPTPGVGYPSRGMGGYGGVGYGAAAGRTPRRSR